MAGQSTRRTRRQKFTFFLGDYGAAGWTQPQEVTGLGWSGLLARGVVRGVNAWPGQLINTEVKVWYGAGYDSSTDPALVPDEDIAWHETGLTINGSTTVADLDKDLLALHNGAAFDIREEAATMWVAFYLSAPAGNNSLLVSLEAANTL